MKHKNSNKRKGRQNAKAKKKKKKRAKGEEESYILVYFAILKILTDASILHSSAVAVVDNDLFHTRVTIPNSTAPS